MNPLNPLAHQLPLQVPDKSFHQHSQQGVNQVNVTEHNTAVGVPNLNGHLLPPIVWGRWFARWCGFFALGCAVPFLVVAAPPLVGVLLPAAILLLLAIGAGYCLVDRRAIGVVLICAVFCQQFSLWQKAVQTREIRLL